MIEYLGLLWPRVPRRALAELFALGRVQSDGRPVSPRRRIGELQNLAVVGATGGLPEIRLPRRDCGVRVLHEDARLTVLAKPAGVPVLPYRGGGGESCLGFLLEREIEERRSKRLAEYVRPRVVHRIDRLTSGLLLVARTPEAERELAGFFARQELRKEYLALLAGDVGPARVTVDCPVGPGRKGGFRAQEKGRTALTEFDVLERFGDFTFALARPRSGRRHQIRVHSWAMGHPVALDPLYRLGRLTSRLRGMERLALHAWRYTLPPPWPPPRVFTCPLPDDLRRALEALREESSPG